jgi:hypothetical protein
MDNNKRAGKADAATRKEGWQTTHLGGMLLALLLAEVKEGSDLSSTKRPS